MPAIAVVTLAGQVDRANNSVSSTTFDARTFSPAGFVSPGITKWVDRSGNVPIAFPSLTLSVRQPNKTSRICRVLAKLVVPVMETGVVPPTKAYDLTTNIEFLCHERSTREQRASMLAMALSMMATEVAANDGDPTAFTGSPLLAAVKDFDPPY